MLRLSFCAEFALRLYAHHAGRAWATASSTTSNVRATTKPRSKQHPAGCEGSLRPALVFLLPVKGERMHRSLLTALTLAFLVGCSSSAVPFASSFHPVDSPGGMIAAETKPDQATLHWQIDHDSKPPNWGDAVSGECANFSFPTDSSLYFPFKRGGGVSGGPCYRDQLNPMVNGNIFYLPMNTTYTWRFQTYIDSDSTAIVWQVHPEGWARGCTHLGPPVGLGVGAANNPPDWHVWAGLPGGAKTWTIPFKNNTTDNWRMVVAMHGTNWGFNAYHDGRLFASTTNIQYQAACKNPFWNFGPYDWEWENPSGPGSHVDVTYKYLKLYYGR